MDNIHVDETLSRKMSLNKVVFLTAAALAAITVLFTMLFPEQVGNWLWGFSGWISDTLGWYYMLVVAAYLICMLIIGLSRYGDIKLGPDHAKPDFPLITWASMLFAAGIGIDLLFFGASEPLTHFLVSPGARPAEIEAARLAITTTFLDWGIHGWGIYALIGMALAYFSYRQRQPLALRSALVPLIGVKRAAGWMGHTVDTFGIVCTIFGIATSLGIGVLQANAGMTHIFGLESSKIIQTIIIVCVIAVASISAMTGVERGVRRLSEINMGMAALLLVALLFMGPTVFLLNAFVQNVGDYFQTLVGKTFDLYAYQGEDSNGWKASWTIFFWAWWIAWAPFVGMFIARISRGRTLREFVFGVLFIPLGFIFAWFSIFGNSAIDLYTHGATQIGEIAVNDPAMGLFALLDQYPWATFWSSIAVIVGLIFFITSADSGALVLANLSTKGLEPEEDAPIWLRLFWAAAIGLITLGLLFAGGFSSLQAVVVISGLPFSFVLLLYMWALMRSLRLEGKKRDAGGIDFTHSIGEGINWRERLSRIISYPTRKQVDKFIHGRIAAAMEAVKAELASNGVKSHFELNEEQGSITLRTEHEEAMDFVYQVVPGKALKPTFIFAQGGTAYEKKRGDDVYWRAEVYLREGGQDYDIMGYSQGQIINDILNQYERHMHFIHTGH
ncbi:choline BCCT transporter BetT [Cardiobacteriaceae bacterium TAE3-ERU3]|nr:choline BCCT transporter BetT [Cardiobacteriaceae bacterium TAE3-ERU3]